MAKSRQYTDLTIKQLFGLSGNVCAHPDCNTILIKEDGSNVAQICHIEAASEGGERYNPLMTDDERRDFKNLILLCSNCHIVTNNMTIYTVGILQRMKDDHEGRYKDNGYKPSPDLYDKMLSKFAYDISFTEKEEWGILEEIIKFVNENAPNSNPTIQQISQGENFTHTKEKVRLNFPQDQRMLFQQTYVMTSAKQQTVAKFFAKIASENSVELDELTEFIVTKYRELKGVSVEDAPIGDMKLIDDLAYQIIPFPKRSSPGYHATAKAIVLQSFEYCHIGKKTDFEVSQLSLFFD